MVEDGVWITARSLPSLVGASFKTGEITNSPTSGASSVTNALSRRVRDDVKTPVPTAVYFRLTLRNPPGSFLTD